ncbi:MAG: GNAT family N-acetyltransferase [Ktedonobacterales bacterium]
MPGTRDEIVGLQALDAAERAQVRDLLARCNTAERLDLKVEIASVARGSDEDTYSIFLARQGGMLAGICMLDGGREIELCGCVHPDYRRRGIGRALLAAACAEAQRRQATKLLLICEDGSRSGQGFIATLEAVREFAEHRMELDLVAEGVPVVTGTLTLRPATSSDQPAIAHITALAFSRDEESERQRLAADMEGSTERFFLALHGSVPVGTLKIVEEPPRALIYGFAVLPAYQGQGYGREILRRMLRLLSAEGWTRIGLEVETENARAYHLYTTTGFRPITTYGYFALSL